MLQKLLEAVKAQQEKIKSEGNVIYDMTKDVEAVKMDEKARRWERTAAFAGINQIASALGGSIAAYAGVMPSKSDSTTLDAALTNAHDIDVDYNDYYKSKLKEAVGTRVESRAADNDIINGLGEIMTYKNTGLVNAHKQNSSFIQSDIAEQNKKDKEERDRNQRELERRQKREETLMDRAQAKRDKQQAAREKEEKTVVSVLGKDGKLIGLNQAMATQMYQIGKEYNLDQPIRDAKSEIIKKAEYHTMISRAHQIYERDKAALKKINKDIEDSSPFTLKQK